MSAPFVFITTHSIHQGELENVRRLSASLTDAADTAGTGLIAYSLHLDVDGTEVSNVQVHENAASMDEYLSMVGGLIAEALEVTTPTSIEVFGTPGPVLEGALRQNAEQGARVTVRPEYVEGFVHRLAA